jgi:hypothetical protein
MRTRNGNEVTEHWSSGVLKNQRNAFSPSIPIAPLLHYSVPRHSIPPHSIPD